MKLFAETSFDDFEPWSGAVDAHLLICNEGDTAAVESYIEALYPDGISDGTLNDWLWFEPEDLYEAAGLKQCPRCETWCNEADLDYSDADDDYEEYCESCRDEINEAWYAEQTEEDEEDEEENE